ncbi:hypothetical protein QAD02_016606 [Eretmocerus hayati]|uniref:Uncharacterized protein n=1 Tax=Eretmocerus hayati TaxID=131215 RepID=A0ACC2PC09_9HYME|nr:hypothetical protein QAD02_016606 [Eretmocerus hayati]
MNKGEVDIRPLFHWVFDIEKDNVIQKYHSPSFWFTDSRKITHEWRLEFEPSTSKKPDATVILRYLDDKNIALGDVHFQVQFRTFGNLNDPKIMFQDLYNDSTQQPNLDSTKKPRLEPIKSVFPQNFTQERPTCKVQFSSVPLDRSQITIWCRISAKSIEACTDQWSKLTTQSNDYLKNDYEAFLTHSKFSDVTVVVEGKKLFLNKNILSNRSPVFAAEFARPVDGIKDNVVNIGDFTYKAMLEFFRYIYAAKVNDIECCVTELFVAADKYAVKGLKSLCEETMMRSLSVRNAFTFLSLANEYKVKDLESQSIKFIALNSESIFEGPNYDLNLLPKDFVCKLFSSLAKECNMISSTD